MLLLTGSSSLDRTLVWPMPSYRISSTPPAPGDCIMDWRLELVVVPVSDVDQAKSFYTDTVGFVLLVDHRAGDFRVVQLTPPGSSCAIALMSSTAAGSIQGLHLIVSVIDAARAELVERGADVSSVFHYEEGIQVPGADPGRGDYASFLSFSDPDGNGWLVQEVRR